MKMTAEAITFDYSGMAVFGKSFSGKGESGPEKICVLRSGTGFCRIPDGKPQGDFAVLEGSGLPMTIPFREMLYLFGGGCVYHS
jgi:hypothetical protein